MKRHILYLCTIGISLFLNACISEIERNVSIATDGEAEITVSEAREFFEQEMLTRNDDTPSPNVLSPGDFTPRWDDAKISQNHRIACVDVPIIPKFAYRAIRSEYRLGKATAYIVKVSQKLVIVKDRESGNMTQYIMSLIPDKNFAAKHKGDISDLFLNAGDRGNYSGAVFYTYYGVPVNYVHYTDGDEDCNISIYGNLTPDARAENYRKIMKKFIGIKFKKTKNISSRASESGDDDDDFMITDNPDDIEEPEEDPYEFPGLYPIGSGYYIDDDGNSYFDADGDGIPEREFNLKEDPHEFEDSNHENNDKNPDEGDDSAVPEGGMTSEKYLALGNRGFERVHSGFRGDIYLLFKELTLKNGQYILDPSLINTASQNAICDRYRFAPVGYHSDETKKDFGEDIYNLLKESNSYSHYWINERTYAIIVHCDDNISLQEFKDGTVSNGLSGTAAIVRDAIEIAGIDGVSRFTIGLIKTEKYK